jgi:FAD:protein FMN transferase
MAPSQMIHIRTKNMHTCLTQEANPHPSLRGAKQRNNLYICVTLILFILTGCSKNEEIEKRSFVRTIPIMGTFLEVKVYQPDSFEISNKIDLALQLSSQLEKIFNPFDPESEINILNRTKKMKVSSMLFDVMKCSVLVGNITGGEFDVTVAPILKQNGFYKDMPKSLLDEIPEEYYKDGWERIFIDENSSKITLDGNIWVDLAGIAKGYIVDKVSRFLVENGVKEYIINAGGDMFCSERPDGARWTIGIREPGSEKVIMALKVGGKAVATSGDYENYLLNEIIGEEVAHIVDPARQVIIKKETSSITVISDFCISADALATAMMAMGKDKAIVLADKLDEVEIIIVSRDRDSFDIQLSKGASKYITAGN